MPNSPLLLSSPRLPTSRHVSGCWPALRGIGNRPGGSRATLPLPSTPYNAPERRSVQAQHVTGSNIHVPPWFFAGSPGLITAAPVSAGVLRSEPPSEEWVCPASRQTEIRTLSAHPPRGGDSGSSSIGGAPFACPRLISPAG